MTEPDAATDEGNDPAEQWEVYPCQTPEGLAVVRVDVGLEERVPDPARPVCVTVATTLQGAGEDGLMGETEAAALERVEDAFCCALDHTLAGVVTAAGRRTWYLYVADVEILQRQLADVGDVPGGYALEVGAFEDAEWAQFRGFLYPNPLAWGWINDRRLLAKLQEMGDDGTRDREIEHYAYFREEKGREEFRLAAQELGIKRAATTDPTTDADDADDADDDFPFGLKLSHRFAPANIFPLAERLRIAAAQADGAYDGWETVVAT